MAVLIEVKGHLKLKRRTPDLVGFTRRKTVFQHGQEGVSFHGFTTN